MDDLIRRSDIERALECSGVTKRFAIRRMIASIPAVDAVEVRHGRWMWDGYVYDAPWQCSECREFNDIESNYCPYCGARMDGRREDGDGDD